MLQRHKIIPKMKENVSLLSNVINKQKINTKTFLGSDQPKTNIQLTAYQSMMKLS